MTPEEFADALKQLQEGQGKLRGDLEGLMKGLEGMGIQPGEGFGEAGEAMGEAETRARRGPGRRGRRPAGPRAGSAAQGRPGHDAADAAGHAGRRGRQRGRRPPAELPTATRSAGRAPPSVPTTAIRCKVPDEIDVQRARQILEAIRKRLGNALSPQIERDYLERLLELK